MYLTPYQELVSSRVTSALPSAESALAEALKKGDPGQALRGLAAQGQGYGTALMNLGMQPLNTEDILGPITRSYTEDIFPQIRSMATKLGAPGGSGEQELGVRAAGRFGQQATEALSLAELNRRNTAGSLGSVAKAFLEQAGTQYPKASEYDAQSVLAPYNLNLETLKGLPSAQMWNTGSQTETTTPEDYSTLANSLLTYGFMGFPGMSSLASILGTVGGQIGNLFSGDSNPIDWWSSSDWDGLGDFTGPSDLWGSDIWEEADDWAVSDWNW
jgi:hypothetical protein